MKLQVRQFYADKVVLMTGITGFVGKVLLEKFLRECTNFKKLYLLIRMKPKKTLQERLMREIFGSPIFIPLFTERPEIK